MPRHAKRGGRNSFLLNGLLEKKLAPSRRKKNVSKLTKEGGGGLKEREGRSESEGIRRNLRRSRNIKRHHSFGGKAIFKDVLRS